MLFTVVLGVTFLCFQAYEYGHAYSDLNLKLSTGVYGSTFFMLTGFHGFHVTLGTIMLTVILARCLAGHFRPEKDRKSTRLNSSHVAISYAVFCLKKKKNQTS